MKVVKHSFDGVIVGAGGAGLRAAIEAAPHMKLAVITKLYPTRSHTGAAQGGMSAALANVEEDNWNWHAFDTVKGSDYLADQPAVDILCKEAIDSVVELEHWGLPFSRLESGKIAQRRFGGHTVREGEAPAFRACYAADRTGHMILQTLYQKCVSMGVTFFDEFQVLDIKIDDGVCKGVIAYEIATGDIHIFEARAVTFATGGFGKIYKVSSNAHSLTGDGPGILYQKGIPLEDMEFYQFHPTGIYRLGILLSEAARGEGGILRNKDGERFMERYAPSIKDLAPRDMVSRAIATEISEGNGAGPNNDFVYLDLTHLGAETIKQKLPDITDFVRTYVKIEPINEPIPVQPTAHYAMGGIPTDVNARVLSDATGTVLPGVYSAGESACVSVHGANRLGTNSLLDIVVFGKRAGQSMVDYVSSTKPMPLSDNAAEDLTNKIENLMEKNHNPEFSVPRIREELQDSMEENAKIFRSEDSLEKQTKILSNLRDRYQNVTISDKGKVFNTELLEAIELEYLLDMSDTTVASALHRKESRGAHSRVDHVERDDKNWLKHSFAFKNGDSVKLEYKDVELGNYEPKERKY
ncbi:MAG: succinate dehydrogenase flavoprotein subunit [Candidatus Actinomarina sp.]|jgi:succinate dehydrogenase / fumarate reductase flavoprotein subunit|nr:succinate dehydrogenase flavoprotein subunit [Candidatus Actinomarina sp.]MDA2946758.1 succinate dehydrogenase flavoprotein subunit [Actinomycetota bacterium]MBL6762865.1 succinate dehydrogenase flavoprotein subunit [Candidatus Actinomarina sp.]MBL6835682.1 succinate dehydrogenase flavoprotein subunit [Candidatus Actinomarina sp.]MDA3008306.1 succinate dehydrogenase flavoprotein subunit [Actinomycetota bacterium]